MSDSQLDIGFGIQLIPYRRVKLGFRRRDAASNVSVDEWKLKQTVVDILKKHVSFTPEEKDLQIQKERDLQKKPRDHPVATGLLCLSGAVAQDDSRISKVIQALDNVEIRLLNVKLTIFASLETSSDWTHFKSLWEEKFGRSTDEYGTRRPGERPDTLKIKRVPSRFLAELTVSSKPSVLVTHTIFSVFGPIKNLEVISDDDVSKILRKSSLMNKDNKTNDNKSPLLSSFLHCDVIIQYAEHASFVKAVKALAGKAMQKSGSIVLASYDLEIVLENYFDERNVRKRKFEKEREAQEEKREKEEKERRRLMELRRKELEMLEKERLEREEQERKIEEERQRQLQLEKERELELERERQRERELQLARERELEEELKRKKEEMVREIEERIKREMEEQMRRKEMEEEAHRRDVEEKERERKSRGGMRAMKRGREDETRGERYVREGRVQDERMDVRREEESGSDEEREEMDVYALYEKKKREMFNRPRGRLERREVEEKYKVERNEDERYDYARAGKTDYHKHQPREEFYEHTDEESPQRNTDEEDENQSKDGETRWVLEETQTHFSNYFHRNLEIYSRLASENPASPMDKELAKGNRWGIAGRLRSEVSIQ